MDIKTIAPATTARRPRPLSPNIQIYRPQLTSVLSIANRITGIVLSVGAVGLVIWFSAAVAGPGPYAIVQQAIGSWIGRIVMLGLTLAFFLHMWRHPPPRSVPSTASSCCRSIFPDGPSSRRAWYSPSRPGQPVSISADGSDELPILPLSSSARSVLAQPNAARSTGWRNG